MSQLTPSDDVQQFICNMVNVFDKGPFKKLRSSDKFSIFPDPGSIFGHTPSITAEDDSNRFYVMEVVEAANMDLDETQLRLEAFAKKSRISKSIFWILISLLCLFLIS